MLRVRVVQMIDAAAVHGRGAADHAVDLVTLGEEKLREIRAVLAGNTCNQCDLGHAEESLWPSPEPPGDPATKPRIAASNGYENMSSAFMQQRPQILARATEGDPDSFAVLLEPLLDPAYRLAAIMLGDRSAAEDA